MDKDQMLGPEYILLRLTDIGIVDRRLELFEADQKRKRQGTDIDAAHIMSGLAGGVDISGRQTGAKALRPRIRVAVYDKNPLGHRFCSIANQTTLSRYRV